jgi:hypothetical protein
MLRILREFRRYNENQYQSVSSWYLAFGFPRCLIGVGALSNNSGYGPIHVHISYRVPSRTTVLST